MSPLELLTWRIDVANALAGGLTDLMSRASTNGDGEDGYDRHPQGPNPTHIGSVEQLKAFMRARGKGGI